MSFSAFLVAAALGFDAGADLRIRQEMMDNVPGLPGGGLVSRAERSGYKNHMRFRTRVWGELKGDAGEGGVWRLHTRLTDECRWYVKPHKDTYTFPDEVIVDNLFLEGKGLFDGLMDVSVGRQDILGLYGLDHVFVDGTPGDGSRSVYSDVVRAGFQLTEESRLDLFALYDFDDNPLRWGTDRGKHRSMCGMAGGTDPEADDWGFGAVWSSKLAPWLPYQLFVMQKNTHEYDLGGKEMPWTQRELVGAKFVPQLNDEWSLQFEGMGQVGVNGDHDTLTGWSGYAGANWKSARQGIRPFARFGYHFMSGDDDAATEEGGHAAWDPMWARGVNDSELFLYGTHYGVAWWSNQHLLKLTAGLDLGRRHVVTGSVAPLFAAAQDGLGGGDGWFKGLLSQLKYEFPLWLADKEKGERLELYGHLLVEFFNPGDYFETDRPSWFARWQFDLKF